MSQQNLASPGPEFKAVQTADRPNQVLDFTKRVFRGRETGIALVVLAIVVYLSLATDTFFTASNLAVVSRQNALSAVIAMGMTLVILTGGILEEHGPHLPSFTDGYSNEWLTQKLAEEIVRRPGKTRSNANRFWMGPNACSCVWGSMPPA